MAAPGRNVRLGHISEAETIGYWSLAAASGDRVARMGNVLSSTGSNGPTLTQNGTVTQGTRTLGNSAVFDGNAANHLSAAITINGNKGFWVSALVKPTALGTSTRTFVSCYNTLSNGFFTLDVDANSKARFLIRDSAGGLTGIASTASLQVNTWYLLQGWIEQRAAEPAVWDVALQINGEVAESGATTAIPWGAGTATLMVGRRQTSGGELPLTGEVAELAIRNRTPTVTERSLLWQILQRRASIHDATPIAPTNVRPRLLRGAPILVGTCQSEATADGGIVTRQKLDDKAKTYGAHANMVQFYRSSPKPELLTTSGNQGANNWKFRKQGFEASFATGAIPVLTLEFFYFDGTGAQTFIDWEQLRDGTYDEFLLLYCNELRKFGMPVILRIFHEMDLRASYQWGQAANNSDTPPKVVASWKYVVRFIREELSEHGSTDYQNVWFAWCPNRNPSPGTGTYPWNTAVNYHPGSGWIDIYGTDGYNFVPDYNASPLQMLEAQNPNYTTIKGLVNIASVPFVIFECNTKDTGTDYTSWMTKGVEDCMREGVAGVFIFDVPSKDWYLRDNLLTQAALPFKKNEELGPIR